MNDDPLQLSDTGWAVHPGNYGYIPIAPHLADVPRWQARVLVGVVLTAICVVVLHRHRTLAYRGCPWT
jgi:hypothetical protein